MSRVAYVDGQYLPHRSAAVHIEDRGYQFADGVYEVIAVVGGQFLDEEPHLVRLARSLAELEISPPMPDAALKIVMREVIRRNRVQNGYRLSSDHSRCRRARPCLPAIRETRPRRDLSPEKACRSAHRQ